MRTGSKAQNARGPSWSRGGGGGRKTFPGELVLWVLGPGAAGIMVTGHQPDGVPARLPACSRLVRWRSVLGCCDRESPTGTD